MSGFDGAIKGLSNYVRDCLRSSGWHEGRAIDISAYEASLTKDGYELFQAARDWLTAFGGLVLPADQGVANWHFDATKATGNIYPEKVGVYSKEIGSPLCVIGEARTGHMTLMISPSGAIYGALDHLMWLVGDEAGSAFRTLCGETDFISLSSLPGGS